MTRRVYKEALAESDLIEHIDYLQDQASFEVALRFIDAVEQAMNRLADWPEIGVHQTFSHPHLDHVRMRPIPVFSKYQIFYRYVQNKMQVLRILYGTRDIPPRFEPDD